MVKKTKPKRGDGALKFLSGFGKELALVGLYAVQETTGADLHYKPAKKTQPWDKKWGEK